MKRAYLVGIGGIGMSALAQLLAHEGVRVTGSDRERSLVTDLLESKGIKVVIPQSAENVPADAEVIIYSDAVPAENPERARAAALGIPQFSYFQMLGKVSEGKRTIAVAGTHGKTTTTGMLATILRSAGANPTAIIGSLVRDFGSNYLPGSSELFVVEACEYRDHLLELSPEVLVITNLEWDHTDYFPSLAALQETFRKAVAKVPAHGVIVANLSDPQVAPVLATAQAHVIDYERLWAQEAPFSLLLPGEFNQANARAAAAAAKVLVPGLSMETLRGALSGFHGTWRRFEYKGKTVRGADVYDDYAHHPTAVRKTLEALRVKTSGKVMVAFHPHLYSRTRDLFEEFARAFGAADEVYLAPIYAAREQDDGSVSSEMLAARIRENGIHAEALDFSAIRAKLENAGPGDSIMTMGAGDIYKIADTIAMAREKWPAEKAVLRA